MKLTALALLVVAASLPAAETPVDAGIAPKPRPRLHLLPEGPVVIVEQPAEKKPSPAIAEPAPRAAPPVGEPKADGDVVMMEAFTVEESSMERSQVRDLEERHRRREAENFTWRNGGTIMDKEAGPLRVRLGAWPAGGFIPFLKIDW